MSGNLSSATEQVSGEKLLKMHSLRDLKVKTGNSDEALRQGS